MTQPPASVNPPRLNARRRIFKRLEEIDINRIRGGSRIGTHQVSGIDDGVNARRNLGFRVFVDNAPGVGKSAQIELARVGYGAGLRTWRERLDRGWKRWEPGRNGRTVPQRVHEIHETRAAQGKALSNHVDLAHWRPRFSVVHEVRTQLSAHAGANIEVNPRKGICPPLRLFVCFVLLRFRVDGKGSAQRALRVRRERACEIGEIGTQCEKNAVPVDCLPS
ncbi:hypothetical protein B0H16DRAFT_1473563 [Mycena metata]|uniref:Uncharacterized protein n=1 Tax=Mycena metata TaxID=1033252 RepID=A0AAD7HJI3_9AGAR|nr:hypothetical protein B0H16DRAFT_1473563 [Mycena metata]